VKEGVRWEEQTRWWGCGQEASLGRKESTPLENHDSLSKEFYCTVATTNLIYYIDVEMMHNRIGHLRL